MLTVGLAALFILLSTLTLQKHSGEHVDDPTSSFGSRSIRPCHHRRGAGRRRRVPSVLAEGQERCPILSLLVESLRFGEALSGNTALEHREIWKPTRAPDFDCLLIAPKRGYGVLINHPLHMRIGIVKVWRHVELPKRLRLDDIFGVHLGA